MPKSYSVDPVLEITLVSVCAVCVGWLFAIGVLSLEESAIGKMIQSASMPIRPPAITQPITGFFFKKAFSFSIPFWGSSFLCTPRGRLLAPLGSAFCSAPRARMRCGANVSPFNAERKVFISANRSSVLSANAFINAFSMQSGSCMPSSVGVLSVSPCTRSIASGGKTPVTHRYSVAPMAYTSVHGPWLPWLEYCSSGA